MNATSLYPTEELHSVDFIFGILSMLCFIIGTPTSFFCFLFFSRKPKKTINIIMFILISATDLVTCSLVLFIGLSALNVHFFFLNAVFCNVWGVLWSVFIKLSIVMIAVLSITRTVSILHPLSKVSANNFLAIVCVYLIVFVAHSTVPYWFGFTYTYNRTTARCTWDNNEVYGWGVGKVAEYIIIPILTFLLPTLTVMACFCVLMGKLLIRAYNQALHKNGMCRQKSETSVRRPRVSVISVASTMSRKGDAKVHSTITVLILTVFYITLTVPSTVMRLIGYTHELSGEIPYQPSVSYDVYRLVTTYFLPVNSLCNTVLYYIRLRDLRAFTHRFVCKMECMLAYKRTSVISHQRSSVSAPDPSCVVVNNILAINTSTNSIVSDLSIFPSCRERKLNNNSMRKNLRQCAVIEHQESVQ